MEIAFVNAVDKGSCGTQEPLARMLSCGDPQADPPSPAPAWGWAESWPSWQTPLQNQIPSCGAEFLGRNALGDVHISNGGSDNGVLEGLL